MGQQTSGPHFAPALLGDLQKPGQAHFDKLVEIARRDGQELHAFEQRIGGVERLLEHTMIELEPRELAVEEQSRPFRQLTAHLELLCFEPEATSEMLRAGYASLASCGLPSRVSFGQSATRNIE